MTPVVGSVGRVTVGAPGMPRPPLGLSSSLVPPPSPPPPVVGWGWAGCWLGCGAGATALLPPLSVLEGLTGAGVYFGSGLIAAAAETEVGIEV